jgi:hypothetical protein
LRYERLQILLRQPLLGELGDDNVKTLGAERKRVLALRLAGMNLPQGSKRCPEAVDGWRERSHGCHLT